MLEVQKMKLEQALRVLDSVKGHVRYAVEWEDRTYGNAELVKPKPVGKRRPLKYPYGTLTTYTIPYLDALAKEGVVEIPWGQFDPDSLAGCISSICSRRFGNKMASLITNKANKTIEVWLDPEAMKGETTTPAQPGLFDDGPTAAN